LYALYVVSYQNIVIKIEACTYFLQIMLYGLFKIKFIVHIHKIFNILSVAESTQPDSVPQPDSVHQDTIQNTPADDVRYFYYQHVFSIIFMKDIKLLVIYHNFVG